MRCLAQPPPVSAQRLLGAALAGCKSWKGLSMVQMSEAFLACIAQHCPQGLAISSPAPDMPLPGPKQGNPCLRRRLHLHQECWVQHSFSLMQGHAGGNASVAELLMAFKQSFSNFEERWEALELYGWSNATADIPCAWSGIYCDSDGTLTLVLHGTGLEGGACSTAASSRVTLVAVFIRLGCSSGPLLYAMFCLK